MIQPLTSIRFFFALLVFFAHSSDYLSHYPIYDFLFKHGSVGVSFFFILSGYILAYSNSETEAKVFYVNRFARIYPTHFITLLFSFPIIFNTPRIIDLYALGPNILLLHSWFPSKDISFGYNSVSWSISAEFFFYLMFPLLVRLKTNLLYLGLLLFLILMITVTLLNYEFEFFITYSFPVTRIFDFAFGIAIFYFFQRYFDQKVNWNLWINSIVEFASIISIVAVIYYFKGTNAALFTSVIFWPSIGGLLIILHLNNGLISKILSNKFFVKLGEISFAFYMFHQLVIRYTTYILEKVGIQKSIFVFILMAILITIISYISYEFFERPLNKWIRTKFKTNG